MAFEAGSVIARIKADLTEFQAGLKKAQDATKGMADKMKESWSGLNAGIEKHKQGLQSIGIAAAAVGAAGTLMLRDWVQNANEAARSQAQLDAVLKSTKGAAGLTSKEVNDLANKYQKLTTIGDDAIRSGQNILLTFTGIKKDAFEPATVALLDMATAMNGGATPSAEQLKAQATQLGKALNDPIKGMAALSRNGVVFTEEQAALITKLQESGDLLGAQKIILNELATEYGGSAAAQAATFEGKLAQLNNRWGDFKEQLGFAVIPVLEQLMEVGGRVMAWLETLSPATVSFIAKLVLFGTAAALIVAPFAGFVLLIPAFTAGLTTIAALFTTVTGIVAGFAIPLAIIGAAITAFVIAWQTDFLGLRTFLEPWFLAVNTMIEEQGGWIMLIPNAWNIVVEQVSAALTVLQLNFMMWIQIITLSWNTFWQNISNFFKGISINLQLGVKAMFDKLGEFFDAGISLLSTAWGNFMSGITTTATSAWNGVKQVFVDSINWLIDKMNGFLSALSSVGNLLGKALGLKKGALDFQIPRLATGGIVTSPTLAMIGEGGEPEAVIPLSKMGEMGAGGGVHIHVDGAIIGSVDAAVDLLDMAIRRVRPSLGI